MFTFFFFSFVFSVNEDLFGSGDQCLCATIPEECNANCACDPYCTEGQIATFNFTLPEQIGENQVVCDSKNQIRSVHSSSISTFESEDGTQCYVYTPEDQSNQYIKSYSPNDFGLTSFAQAVSDDSLPSSTILGIQGNQNSGDPVVLTDENNLTCTVFFPISIGSSAANAFIPYRSDTSYTNKMCYIQKLSNLSYTFGVYATESSFDIDINSTNDYYQFPSSKTDPITSDKLGLPDGFILIEQTSSTSTVPDEGYIFGSPILNMSDDNQPILINGESNMPLIFGQNTNVVFRYTSGGSYNDTFNLGNLHVRSRYRQNNKEPEYVTLINNSNDSTWKAYWSIFYQKIGSNTDYSYTIKKVKSEILVPAGSPQPAIGSISLKFYELSSDGSGLKEYPEEGLFSYSLSVAFDTFFVRNTDSVRTSGVFFLFGLIGTIWAYYSFYFTSS